MTLAIATSLVGSLNPQAVQIAVTGATNGVAYQITGTAGGITWFVRAGNPAVAVGTSIILVDVATPINLAITYSVTDGTTTANATPRTVPYVGDLVLTGLDGKSGVTPLRVRDNNAPRSLVMRQATFAIKGRLLPVVRYDVPGGETGQVVVDTLGAQTAAMFSLLQLGGLMLIRTNGSLRDLPAVQFVLVTGVQSVLPDIGNERIWTLDYQVVSDPEPDSVVAAVTWDDFDSAYSLLTWANFDTEWSTGTWDQFDLVDWSAR